MPVDGLYGDKGWKAHLKGTETWNAAQSYLNLAEVAATCLFLLLANYNDALSNIFGIIISTATSYKTVTYFVLEALSGWKYTKHNDDFTFWTSYILPSSIWIIVPVLVIITLSTRIMTKL